MAGPVSDSYDPEWSTGANADEIREALQTIYNKLSRILKDKEPIYILDLVRARGLSDKITAKLTEKEWRILRFACERAKDSI